jgi:hypothetical protein
MASPPSHDFGKRRPAVPTSPSAPVKRSRHVALLLTGAFAIGGSAYALMPRDNCQPNSPGMAAPSSPTAATTCGSHVYSGGGHGGSGGYWSRSNFYGGSSASSEPSAASGTTETTRGGFGSFARAISAHFSGT